MAYDPKGDLLGYLRHGRQAVVWKLDGLGEREVRRPMTGTGTNLLGLVKHLATVESGYFGVVFDRPFPETLAWMSEGAEANDDMWATADESRVDVVELYRRVWAHSDATIAALALDAVGQVPWWPPERRAVTLHQVLVHVIAETDRHAGHADIVRELLDGSAGRRQGASDLPEQDAAGWAAYRDRLQAAADAFT